VIITKEIQDFLDTRIGDVQIVKRCANEGKYGRYQRFKWHKSVIYKGKCIGAYYTRNGVYYNEAYIIRKSLSGKLVSAQNFTPTRRMTLKRTLEERL